MTSLVRSEFTVTCDQLTLLVHTCHFHWVRVTRIWSHSANCTKSKGCFNDKFSLQWHHNESDGISNHQPNDCLLNRLFRRRSRKSSMLRVTGLCLENSPVTGVFPTQMASNVETVSIWWRHHGGTCQTCPSDAILNCYLLHDAAANYGILQSS